MRRPAKLEVSGMDMPRGSLSLSNQYAVRFPLDSGWMLMSEGRGPEDSSFYKQGCGWPWDLVDTRRVLVQSLSWRDAHMLAAMPCDHVEQWARGLVDV